MLSRETSPKLSVLQSLGIVDNKFGLVLWRKLKLSQR